MSLKIWAINSLMVDFIISGANGFIGRSLSRWLSLSGFTVHEMRGSDCRVEDENSWLKVPMGKSLIHLAGKSYVPDSWVNQADFLRTNVIGTQNAIDFCIRNKMKMIYVSAYLYGPPKYLPIPETHPINPNNPYAHSKHLAEQLCGFAHKYKGLDVAILRLFNVYGSGQRSDFLIPGIINQVLNGHEIVVNDLEPKRDYVYIDDVVEAISLVAQNIQEFLVLNIGSGHSISVREVIDIIQEACGTALPIRSKLVVRSQEIPDVVANIEMANREVGWKPKISFRQGIEKILIDKLQIKGNF